MSVFGGNYSSYYDLFYAGKDYAAEAAFVKDIIRRHNPNATSLVEFGCGSARHAVEFARTGFSITGVDRSANMIERGQSRIDALDPRLRTKIKLMQGDATLIKSSESFEAVVSLFHVVSYQTANEALVGIFRAARSALVPDGLFDFD